MYVMKALETRTHSLSEAGVKQETRMDRLSDLPPEILNLILVKLPLEDAVKTSVLSRRWRHLWKDLSHLILDTLPRDIISSLLKSHKGNIDQLRFPIVPRDLEHKIDEWIDISSQKQVKGLMIRDHILLPPYAWPWPPHIWPPCILQAKVFAFESLVDLQIIGHVINVPSSFQGFKRLRSLHLRCIRMSNDDFYKLVSSCTSLESLTLERLDRACSNEQKNLRISAQNLKELEFVYDIDQHVSLENCPSIVSMAVLTRTNPKTWFSKRSYWDFNNACRPNCLGGLIKVQDLPTVGTEQETSWLEKQIARVLFQSLGSGITLERLCLPGKIFTFAVIMKSIIPEVCSRLKTLHLIGVALRDQNSVQALHLMLVHSPLLEQLNIVIYSDKAKSITKFVEEVYKSRNLSLEKLRFVKVKYMHDYEVSEDAFEILNLIVKSAPVLEELTLRDHRTRFQRQPGKAIMETINRLKMVCTSSRAVLKHEFEWPTKHACTL